MESTASSSAVPSDHVELFVKAGRDGTSLGGCPLCHRLFMLLTVKADAGALTLTTTPIVLARPPPDFRRRVGATRLPALRHGDETLSDPDDMIQYVDEHFPLPTMPAGDLAAADACRDVFSKFSFFIKDVAQTSTPLMAELRRLSGYLEVAGCRYLSGDDRPGHLDCAILPKLQHIRIAVKAFKNFDIDVQLVGLWRYLAAAYACDAFTRTCPSDQEIIAHWMDKPECPSLNKEKRVQLGLDGPSMYSFHLPTGLVQI